MTWLDLALAYLRYTRRSLAAFLAVITALLVLGIPLAYWYDSQAAKPAGTWTAGWASVSEVQANWQTVGAPCYSVTPGRLRLTCQSAGLVTRQAWSPLFPLTVTTTISASAYAGSKYFAGLTVY